MFEGAHNFLRRLKEMVILRSRTSVESIGRVTLDRTFSPQTVSVPLSASPSFDLVDLSTEFISARLLFLRILGKGFYQSRRSNLLESRCGGVYQRYVTFTRTVDVFARLRRLREAGLLGIQSKPDAVRSLPANGCADFFFSGFYYLLLESEISMTSCLLKVYR